MERITNDRQFNKNTDLLGNEIKAGDILLELGRGGGNMGGGKFYCMKLWEMPESYDGHAYYYSIDGSRGTFAWAHVGSALKIDMSLMPDGFEYSFKHGMSDFNSKIEYGTLTELIENSDWKNHEVKKHDVHRFEFMETLEINSIDDIKNNIDELRKSGHIPHEIITKVLELSGIGRMPVNNGEIGIASIYDQMHYAAIIEALN